MTDDLDRLLSELLSSIAEYNEAQAEYSQAAEGCDTPDYSCRAEIDRCQDASEAFKSDFVAAVKAAMREPDPEPSE